MESSVCIVFEGISYQRRVMLIIIIIRIIIIIIISVLIHYIIIQDEGAMSTLGSRPS